MTLSGMLNFMDGLWSCCGEERIIVFTTNNKDKLDPALLRPGRMDMHIYFPHCSFPSFKILANNYLGVKDHKLFPNVEEAFQAGVSITPAEVGEILLVNKNSPSRALKVLINALQSASPERPVENGYQRETDRRPMHEILPRKGGKATPSDELVTKGRFEQSQEDRTLYSPNHSFVDLKKLHHLFKRSKSRNMSGDMSPVIKEQ